MQRNYAAIRNRWKNSRGYAAVTALATTPRKWETGNLISFYSAGPVTAGRQYPFVGAPPMRIAFGPNHPSRRMQ